MSTAEKRARSKGTVPKGRRGYPTDISEKEWELVDPLLPRAARIGRSRKTALQ